MNSNFILKRIIVSAVVFFACLESAFAWTVLDAHGKWSFPAPEGWYGGSYSQIMERLNAAQQKGDSDSPALKILESLSREAYYFDAILVNPGASDSGGWSLVKINSSPTFRPITEQTWPHYAKVLQSHTPDAKGVQLIGQENIVIRGNQVDSVAFKVIVGAGRDRYQHLIVIHRPSGGVTTLFLDAPWQTRDVQVGETWEMVRSMEFSD